MPIIAYRQLAVVATSIIRAGGPTELRLGCQDVARIREATTSAEQPPDHRMQAHTGTPAPSRRCMDREDYRPPVFHAPYSARSSDEDPTSLPLGLGEGRTGAPVPHPVDAAARSQ